MCPVGDAVAQSPEGAEGIAIPLASRSMASDGGRRISLAQAVELALSDNLDLALARAEEQVAIARRGAARGALLPSLEAGAFAGRQNGRIQNSEGRIVDDLSFSTYQGGAALTYRANIGSRLWEARAERKSVEAASLQALDAEQRLLLRVGELYQDLMLTSVGVRIAEQLVEVSREFVDIVAARVEAGLGLGAELARARSKLASDRVQLIRARNERDAAGIRLAVALNADPAVRWIPIEANLAPEDFAGEAAPSTTAAERRPDVRAAQREVEAAHRSSTAAKMEIWVPELHAAIGRLQLGESTDDFAPRDQRDALLLWTIRPQDFGRAKQRRAEERASQIRSEDVRNRARGEIAQAERDLEAAGEAIPLAVEQAGAAEDNLRLVDANFRAGRALLLEVLDAQDELARSRFTLASAVSIYNAAQLRLLAATGTLDRSDFE
jgi:outer membrane protein TolC